MSRPTKRFLSSSALVAALAAGLVCCGDGGVNAAPEPNAAADASPEPEPPAPEGGKYEVAAVSNGGTLTGTVTWQGPVPDKKTIAVTKDGETCGHEKPNQEILVGANKTLKNAVVSIDGIKSGEAFKADAPIVFDQKECLFLHHVAVVPTGATLDVRNSDDILHNTHFNAVKNKGENFAIPAGKSNSYTVKSAETIKVTCDIHPWMSSWVIVRDNPYFAVTDENGKYTIKNVPPGTYKASVWQETVGKGGVKPVDVEIKAGSDTTQNFDLKPRNP